MWHHALQNLFWNQALILSFLLWLITSDSSQQCWRPKIIGRGSVGFAWDLFTLAWISTSHGHISPLIGYSNLGYPHPRGNPTTFDRKVDCVLLLNVSPEWVQNSFTCTQAICKYVFTSLLVRNLHILVWSVVWFMWLPQTFTWLQMNEVH